MSVTRFASSYRVEESRSYLVSYRDILKGGSMPTVTKIEKKIRHRGSRKIKFRGLCTTCVKASTCTFPRDPGQPVLQCDEFEGYPETSKGAVAFEHVQKATFKVRQEVVSEEVKYRGLCKICDKRETCTFPKPDTGVWHCEEYE